MCVCGVSVFGRGLRTRSWLDGGKGHSWLMVRMGWVWVGDDVDDDDDTMGKWETDTETDDSWLYDF